MDTWAFNWKPHYFNSAIKPSEIEFFFFLWNYTTWNIKSFRLFCFWIVWGNALVLEVWESLSESIAALFAPVLHPANAHTRFTSSQCAHTVYIQPMRTQANAHTSNQWFTSSQCAHIQVYIQPMRTHIQVYIQPMRTHGLHPANAHTRFTSRFTSSQCAHKVYIQPMHTHGLHPANAHTRFTSSQCQCTQGLHPANAHTRFTSSQCPFPFFLCWKYSANLLFFHWGRLPMPTQGVLEDHISMCFPLGKTACA